MKRRALSTLVLVVGSLLALLVLRSADVDDAGRNGSVSSSTIASSPVGDRAAGGRASDSRSQQEGMKAVTLSGRVSSRSGRPLRDASICAFCADCFALERSPAPHCVPVGADGTYSLKELPAGEYRIVASARGHEVGLLNEGRPVRSEEVNPSGNDMELEEGGAELSGVVLDALGGPIAGATVEVKYPHAALPEGRRLEQAVQSDEAGAFAFFTPATRVHVFAYAEGYAPGGPVVHAPASGVQIVLTPASRISGTVVSTADGSPVGGVKVKARGDAGGDLATSDASGAFSIVGLRPGSYRLEASGPGFIGRHSGSVTVDLGDAVDNLVIPVQPAARVSGHVRIGDSPCVTGTARLRPAPGASLPQLSARTDLSGRVVFEAVPPGRYLAQARCDQRGTSVEELVVVGPSNLDGLAFQVAQGTDVVVHVRSPEGNAVPRSFVRFSPAVAKTSSEVRVERSDAQGDVRFASVPEGAYVLDSPTDPESRVQLQVAPSDVPLEATLVLEGKGALEVMVKAPDGAPHQGVAVTARPLEHGPPGLGEPRGAGLYYIGPLAAGEYRVEVRDGTNPVVSAGDGATSVSVAPNETRRVEVTYGGYQGVIAGRVVDERGSPLANVWVSAGPGASQPDELAAFIPRLRQSESERRLTDPEGRFQLEGLDPSGRFAVVASHSLGGQARLDGVAVGEEVELTLSTPGRISGRVFEPSGDPPGYFQLRVDNRAAGQQLASEFGPDAQGNFFLDHVAPGTLEIAATSANGTTQVTSELAPSGTLSGLRIQLASRAPTQELSASAESSALTGVVNERKEEP